MQGDCLISAMAELGIERSGNPILVGGQVGPDFVSGPHSVGVLAVGWQIDEASPSGPVADDPPDNIRTREHLRLVLASEHLVYYIEKVAGQADGNLFGVHLRASPPIFFCMQQLTATHLCM